MKSALTTTIDAKENVLGKWTDISATIDYNRVTLSVNGELVESRALPQPFKYRTKADLLIGNVGEHVVTEKVPHNPFAGSIQSVTIRRPDKAEVKKVPETEFRFNE